MAKKRRATDQFCIWTKVWVQGHWQHTQTNVVLHTLAVAYEYVQHVKNYPAEHPAYTPADVLYVKRQPCP